MPTEGQEQPGEDSAVGGEPRREWDNIPQRLSPNEPYIPAGAEGGDSSLSSSTSDEGETLEQELA